MCRYDVFIRDTLSSSAGLAFIISPDGVADLTVRKAELVKRFKPLLPNGSIFVSLRSLKFFVVHCIR